MATDPIRILRPLLAACVTALAAASAAAQVRLEFDWPDGLQATVTRSRSRMRGPTAAPPTRADTVTFEMAVSARPGGLRVAFGDLRLDPATLPATLEPDARRQLELFAKATLPTYLVKSSGEFDRVEDPAALKAALLGWVAQMAPASTPIDARVRQMLDQVTAPAVLDAIAHADWHQLVGYWVGASLDMGATYHNDSQTSLPMLPGTPIKLNARFRVMREVVCVRGGQARRCVEIELESSADKAEAAAAVDALLRKLSPEAAARNDVLDSIEVEQSLFLLTEPQGLIPHDMRLRKHITVTTRKGDQRTTLHQVEQTEITYRYPDAGR